MLGPAFGIVCSELLHDIDKKLLQCSNWIG
jgi:hypothetical protein